MSTSPREEVQPGRRRGEGTRPGAAVPPFRGSSRFEVGCRPTPHVFDKLATFDETTDLTGLLEVVNSHVAEIASVHLAAVERRDPEVITIERLTELLETDLPPWQRAWLQQWSIAQRVASRIDDDEPNIVRGLE